MTSLMMLRSKCFCILVFCLQISFIIAIKERNNPIVTVKEGKIKGSNGNLVDGSPYYSFKGIPYATPPVGNLRFKNSKRLTMGNGRKRRSKSPETSDYRNRRRRRDGSSSSNTRLKRLETLVEKLIENSNTRCQPTSGPVLNSSQAAGKSTPGDNTEGTLSNLSLENNNALTETSNLTSNVQNLLQNNSSQILNSNVITNPSTTAIHKNAESLTFTSGNDTKFLGRPDNLPKFNGNTNAMPVLTWIHRLESLAKLYGWDERTLVYNMTTCLEGNALLWFGHLQDINISWEEWKKRLCDYFPTSRGLAAKLHEFVNVTKRADEKDDPIVKVNEGKLRGTVGELVDGSSYFSFKGIPYAAPPVGDLRFKAPLPPKRWDGVRDAIDFGAICTQYNSTYQGDEDCLFLNVYTKSLDNDAKIPVMVYIHGGSYYEGSGDFFTPDFLLQHDVILVTLNYRLELLGFLSLDIPEAPGNAGMKDQVEALRWIKKNIVNFGGDKESVTIFGESSGASSVTYHMLSPMSKGLFHKVIAQSGVAIHDWAIGKGSKERAFRAGKILGKDTDDVYELLDYFKSLDANALTNLTFATLTPDERYRGLPEHFVPVVEKKFLNVEAFITENPLKVLVEEINHVNKVPLMLGYNSGEGLILLRDHITKLDVFNKEPSYYVPNEIAERVSEKELKDFGDRIKKFYVGDRNITENDVYIITDMQTDIHFAFNTHRFAHLYTYMCGVSYMYRFNFETDLNIIKIALGLQDLKGVSHADELFYLFYNYLNEIPYKNQERLREIVFKVTKLWTNFAKTGEPTPDDSLGVTWEPYTRDGREYFNIGEPFSMGRFADKERMLFWDEIYREAGVQHLKYIFYPYQRNKYEPSVTVLNDNLCDYYLHNRHMYDIYK